MPQGSVLGPVLFVLYVSNLNKKYEILDFVHFTDDSAVYSKGKDVYDLVNVTNHGLSPKVKAWLDVNILSLNVNKCECSYIYLYYYFQCSNCPNQEPSNGFHK